MEHQFNKSDTEEAKQLLKELKESGLIQKKPHIPEQLDAGRDVIITQDKMYAMNRQSI